MKVRNVPACLFAALLAIWCGLCATGCRAGNEASDGIRLKVDAGKSFLIMASTRAAGDYPGALAIARELHKNAAYETFNPADLNSVRAIMVSRKPHYVMVFLKPGELDVNFAWKWLTMASRIDDDPFVDVSTGFITGRSPEEVMKFMKRIRDGCEGKLTLPRAFVDNLGPNSMMPGTGFHKQKGSFMIPVMGKRFAPYTISHGAGGFTSDHLDSMDRRGILHFGGHGYPDRIVDGLEGSSVGTLMLSPCVVFNGACYTGVTERWFDMFTTRGTVKACAVAPDRSFCLQMLGNNCLAYLAALHPDHGIPVYQEMEYVAYAGAALGDVMRHTYDGVVIGAGGTLPVFDSLIDGLPSPRWSPSEMMLKGTSSRVLFGDPSMLIVDAFTQPPFDVTVTGIDDNTLKLVAAMKNLELRSTFTDTYHADLAADKMQFNDCAYIVADLPEGWSRIKSVQAVKVSAAGKELPHRLVGFALEKDDHARRLHVQVDVPAKGYMVSDLRMAGAAVEMTVSR